MEFKDSAEDAEWRTTVRKFIDENVGDERLNRLSEEMGMGGWDRDSEWRKRLANQGWIAPAWPKEYGGASLSIMQQFILSEEIALARAPSAAGLGVNLAGPTLIVHGSDAQKAEHLPRILSGEVIWCQGFSEPGAGSDLAAIQTRAVRDGDDYVINGQKIWTTGAQYADWMFMLARTDPEAPKHKGISFFLINMLSPGITIRPLIDLAGGHHVNEVFLDSVRVPAENRVGPEGRGWYVATTTLDFERSGIRHAIGNIQTAEELSTLAARRESPASVRSEIAERYIEATIGRLLSWRVAYLQDAGLVPNYEASINKLFNTELKQRILLTGFRVTQLQGTVIADDGTFEHSLSVQHMDAIPATVSAGSSEIQRNIVAQRGLGLPRA